MGVLSPSLFAQWIAASQEISDLTITNAALQVDEAEVTRRG